jgi:multidrug efflux pump subunit AcrA (membrane-fusion protein)
MSDTTTAPAATPEAQAADGQQMEPEQTNSEHAQALSPEQLRAELDAARKEAASYRTKLRQTEKQATDAEAKRLAEQGEYRTLYESVKAKADAADALQERLDAITAQAQAANERRIAAIPEHMRSLVPEYDDALKLAAWLDANAAVFSRPTPPPLDGRAGGNGTPAMVTDDEVNEYAARWGLNPQHIDRAKLAKVAKR